MQFEILGVVGCDFFLRGGKVTIKMFFLIRNLHEVYVFGKC